MHPLFSFARLGKLIAKQYYEHARMYVVAVLALTGLLVVTFTLWIIFNGSSYHETEISVFYFTGLFIGGTILASLSFNQLGQKDRAIYWLSFPATHLEKLICTIFFTTLVFTVVYTFDFYIIRSLAVLFLQEWSKTDTRIVFTRSNLSSAESKLYIRYLFCIYLAVQALYLMGSVYFSRNSFLITTVVGVIFTVVCSMYVIQFKEVFSTGGWKLFSLTVFDPAGSGRYKEYALPGIVEKPVTVAFQYAWAPIFWLVTWFRLKETEI